MKREVKITKDGSKTLYISDLNENYHSHHGAIQEAKHVFIENGIKLIDFCEINILELGFGTGLNLLVTIDEFLKMKKNIKINYFGIEKYPINHFEVLKLEYDLLFSDPKIQKLNLEIHKLEWDKAFEILPQFSLKKIKADFFEIKKMDLPPIHLVYFDCFGARVQPDLWEKPLLEIVSNTMQKGGLFTTYSSKASVQKTLKELHFCVEKKPGPPGKREMINAWKL